MEKVLTVLAAALIAGSAAAEPAKNTAVKPVAKPRPAEVVFASAETSQAPAPDRQPNGASAKRRVARVTTCRCGDPQTESDSQEQ